MITEPGAFDTEVESGATYEHTFYVSIQGDPFIFDGYNFLGAIKARPTDTAEIYSMSLANGNFVTGDPGYITVRIPKEDTADFPVKKLSWSMRCVQPDGDEFPLLAGVFNVKVRRVNG